MSDKKFDLLVFIIRGRLFHNGQKSVIDRAKAMARNVLVLVGSANRSRNANGNEFIATETVQMINAVYPGDGQISIVPIADYMHDEQDLQWLMNVQRVVAEERKRIQQWSGPDDLKIGLIGFSKDRSSYYLKKFPQWESVDCEGYRQNGRLVSATDLRQEFIYGEKFGTEALGKIRNRIPEEVARWLYDWAWNHHDVLTWLREEKAFVIDYKAEHKYGGKPKKYNPTHTTVDSVVIQSGHVLLIRRKNNPGKGKWALPGGFVDEHEYIRDATLRELREETKLSLATNVLRLAFRYKVVFSDPFRSSRGRIVTHAYLYLLNDRRELPVIDPEGGDDADRAEWVPLGELDPLEMYEDHYFIIMKCIGMLPVD